VIGLVNIDKTRREPHPPGSAVPRPPSQAAGRRPPRSATDRLPTGAIFVIVA
jgi:hypothetical protein